MNGPVNHPVNGELPMAADGFLVNRPVRAEQEEQEVEEEEEGAREEEEEEDVREEEEEEAVGKGEGLLGGPLDTILHRGLSPVDLMLLAESIEPANLFHRLDLPPTTLTHLLELQCHALLSPSPELLSLLPVQ